MGYVFVRFYFGYLSLMPSSCSRFGMELKGEHEGFGKHQPTLKLKEV